jgi:hypothetical protein
VHFLGLPLGLIVDSSLVGCAEHTIVRDFCVFLWLDILFLSVLIFAPLLLCEACCVARGFLISLLCFLCPLPTGRDKLWLIWFYVLKIRIFVIRICLGFRASYFEFIPAAYTFFFFTCPLEFTRRRRAARYPLFSPTPRSLRLSTPKTLKA